MLLVFDLIGIVLAGYLLLLPFKSQKEDEKEDDDYGDGEKRK